MSGNVLHIVMVVEGKTEQKVVKEVLQPHFGSSLVLHPSTVMTSKGTRGGLHNYAIARKHIQNLFCEWSRTEAYFSCMFDLHGLPSSFPGYVASKAVRDPIERAKIVEHALREDLAHPRDRFVPHIQVHEIEALMLCSRHALESALPDSLEQIKGLWNECKDRSPEEINDQEPPGKLLSRWIPGYSKAHDGPRILSQVGLPVLRERCPHFDAWLTKLEALGAACP